MLKAPRPIAPPRAAASQSGPLVSLLRRLEVDWSVGFALLARAWPLLVGPVTLVAIASYLSPQAQGFYYTFASLLTLQSFVELGFLVVITQFASHEWASLHVDSLGRPAGDPVALSRLVSLGRLIFAWFAAASAVFMLGVGAAGLVFFSRYGDAGVDWAFPWLMLVAFSGFQLWLAPGLALLDGCNQVTGTYSLRLLQTVISSLVLWLVLLQGGELWGATAAAGAALLTTIAFLLVRFGRFFTPFLTAPVGPRMSWRTEIWPMQWRLAAGGVGNFFAFSLFTPVMFRYHGSVIAGQMGLTWQIAVGLGGLAMAWVATKVPRFGALIAAREFAALDRLFFRVLAVSFGVITLGSLAAWLLIWALNVARSPLASRALPPLPAALLLLGAVALHVSACQSAYLRAHKQEPVMVLSIVSSLIIGLCVWQFGSRFGPPGAAASYLVVVAGLMVPWETSIWLRCRRAWHQP